MKRVLIIALCVILIFCFVSCELIDNEVETETETTSVFDDNDPYTFETVADLLTAIKKNFEQYENMQVSVKGSILKKDDCLFLTQLRGDGGAMFQYEALRSTNITITTLNDKAATVLDNGDYVKIFGTVKISDTEIYLDNCEYEMIKSIYE